MTREPGDLPGCAERSLFVRGVLRFPLITGPAISLAMGGWRESPGYGLGWG